MDRKNTTLILAIAYRKAIAEISDTEEKQRLNKRVLHHFASYKANEKGEQDINEHFAFLDSILDPKSS